MFFDKLNKKEEGYHSIKETVTIKSGVYEGILRHDNVNPDSIMIVDSAGKSIDNYMLSTPEDKSWETHIKIFHDKDGDVDIFYETPGDIVDADDINKIQDYLIELSNQGGSEIPQEEIDVIIKQIETIKNNKAEKEHTHSADDIQETLTKNFVSMADKLKIQDIDGKADKVDIPKMVSELENDVGFITIDEVPEGGGGGTSGVSSVNGKSGRVTLTGEDIKVTSGLFEPSVAEELDRLNSDIDKKADKNETQTQLDNKVERVNNMSGKHITLSGDIIDTELGSGKSITDAIKEKVDKDNVVTSVNGQKGDVVIEGGSSDVTSVNNKQGDVVLTAEDINIDQWVNQSIATKITQIDSELYSKADKSELDKVKQSGVESNKILVDALNSKNVPASTEDSVRVNVNKVNDIESGTQVPMVPTNDLIAIGNQKEKCIELKWSSPKNVVCNGVTITEFKEDILVRNENRIPTDVSDGVKIGLFERDKHKYTPFLDENIKLDTQYYYAIFSVATNNSVIKNGEGKALVKDEMTIGQLPVGALIQDTNSKYYDKPIVWRKLADDHPGYPKNSTTLLSEHILCLKASDGKEPDNPDKDRGESGNNRYIYSNLRQWLNSSESDWFVEQHAYDMPPIGFAVTHNYYYDGFQGNRNGEKGFMTNLSPSFKKSIIPTNLQILKNELDGGGLETATDKIFLLSCTEIGLNNGTNYSEGVRFDYFANNSNRIAYPTQEGINHSTYTDSNLSTNKGWGWWLRTPHNENRFDYSAYVYLVGIHGTRNHLPANNGTRGVRPAVNLDSDTVVSPKPNSNGVYELIF